MGLLKPDFPELDLAQWRTGSRSERLKPMARHIAEHGMGTPDAVYPIYIVKLALFVLGIFVWGIATRGIDGWADITRWWSEPIVFQKAVLWSMLFEVLGLGCAWGPLVGRTNPPMGSPLYWLRLKTIRLPPWPTRIPGTRGDERRPVDIALYAALLIALVFALCSDGTGAVAALGTTVGVIPAWKVAIIVAALAILGLRDKVVFLAARGEIYGSLAVTFLFAAGPDMIVGAKLVMLCIWMGAATSKLNRHFPFVIATMMSNNPFVRPRWAKRMFFRHFPDDLLPSGLSRFIAHGGTAVEFGAPLVLFFSHGGVPTTIAAAMIVAFHLTIISTIPLGAPLEWNAFMIFAALTLFVDKADVGWGDVTNPWPIVALMTVVVGTVVIGNFSPRKVSFLPGMRYYAGNWDTTLWCLTPSARDKIAANTVTVGRLPFAELDQRFGDRALIPVWLGYAFRALFAHGRATFTLLKRTIPPDSDDDYIICEGEMIAATIVGWNFSDGHFHNEQLIAALHRRCHFEPGELRVMMLDGQPIHRQAQEYRIVDAAGGEFERGYVEVADMVSRQPWEHDLPVYVTGQQESVAGNSTV